MLLGKGWVGEWGAGRQGERNVKGEGIPVTERSRPWWWVTPPIIESEVGSSRSRVSRDVSRCVVIIIGVIRRGTFKRICDPIFFDDNFLGRCRPFNVVQVSEKKIARFWYQI